MIYLPKVRHFWGHIIAGGFLLSEKRRNLSIPPSLYYTLIIPTAVAGIAADNAQAVAKRILTAVIFRVVADAVTASGASPEAAGAAVIAVRTGLIAAAARASLIAAAARARLVATATGPRLIATATTAGTRLITAATVR